jgi:short-subunit dehydrogenase
MSETWIILGATSSIAKSFCRLVAARGDAVLLAGRDLPEIQLLANDCKLRGAKWAEAIQFDARKAATFAPIIERASLNEGTINAAVFTGSMPPQADIDADPTLIPGVIIDSYTGPAEFLHMLAPVLEVRGKGCILGVGSVAGDRGRLPNYLYGSTKAGFHTYLAGLRNRLNRSGVHVVTVKPGGVDTAMTWGIPKVPFMASPELVANAMLRAADKKKNVLYTPSIWLIVMTIIKLIPEPVFKKLKI